MKNKIPGLTLFTPTDLPPLEEHEILALADHVRQVERLYAQHGGKLYPVTATQPITTAPREPFTNLLLFDGDWYIGWWHMRFGWVTQGEDGWRPIAPTHWMPLPPKPEGKRSISAPSATIPGYAAPPSRCSVVCAGL